jgi:hypothetical protein
MALEKLMGILQLSSGLETRNKNSHRGEITISL